MTTSVPIARPWSDRQREALRGFVSQAAVRANKEAEVQTRFLQKSKEIDKELLTHVEDVLLNRRPDATERLIAFSETVKRGDRAAVQADAWRAR